MLLNKFNMPISKYQKAKVERLKEKAFELYKQGLTTREVADIIKVRTYGWVHQIVKEKEAETLH